MVRAPCCEKVGLKRGPWTPEEDRKLINYISAYGHGNWRALPKQAGLLRCGKSCRLRWTNYLRPDVKRGNFSKEEEETIIKLHETLGNRWSAIAARLPGRTDNEIKNVWHTHLKKKLMKQNQVETKPSPPLPAKIDTNDQESNLMNDQVVTRLESPQHSATDTSSSSSAAAITATSTTASCMGNDSLLNSFNEMDETFWADIFSVDISGDFQFSHPDVGAENVCGYNADMNDGMDYWFNLFSTAGEMQELPGF